VCWVLVGCGCVSCMCRKVFSMCAECGYVLCMRVAVCDVYEVYPIPRCVTTRHEWCTQYTRVTNSVMCMRYTQYPSHTATRIHNTYPHSAHILNTVLHIHDTHPHPYRVGIRCTYFSCTTRAPFVQFRRAKAAGVCGVRSDVGIKVCYLCAGQGV